MPTDTESRSAEQLPGMEQRYVAHIAAFADVPAVCATFFQGIDLSNGGDTHRSSFERERRTQGLNDVLRNGLLQQDGVNRKGQAAFCPPENLPFQRRVDLCAEHLGLAPLSKEELMALPLDTVVLVVYKLGENGGGEYFQILGLMPRQDLEGSHMAFFEMWKPGDKISAITDTTSVLERLKNRVFGQTGKITTAPRVPNDIRTMSDLEFRDYMLEKWTNLGDGSYVVITQTTGYRKGEIMPHLLAMDETGLGLLEMHRRYLLYMCHVTTVNRGTNPPQASPSAAIMD